MIISHQICRNAEINKNIEWQSGNEISKMQTVGNSGGQSIQFCCEYISRKIVKWNLQLKESKEISKVTIGFGSVFYSDSNE